MIKKTASRWIIGVCLFLSFLIVHSPLAGAGQKKAKLKKVLVVHSYHKTQKGHVDEMSEGIEEALRGTRVKIKYFHMDTKRKNNIEWKKEAGDMAMQLVEEFKPHIVITMDDNAQQYFAKYYAGKKSPIFVFGGVNAEPAKYGFPAKNVTGVIERPNIRESVELLQKIKPGIKKMVMLSDKSPTTDAFKEYAKKLNLPVKVVAYEQAVTFKDWKTMIRKYRNKVDAFGVYVIRTIQRSDSDNTHVDETELISYLVNNCKLPSVGFFDTSAKIGILCGISVSMKEQGYAAAKIAREIINGKKPKDFKVVPTTKGRIQLNLKTAEKLGIDIRYNIIRNATVVVK